MFSRFFNPGKRRFEDLSEQEILALAISSEEDDARIYLAYADGLMEDFPQSAQVFVDMAEEEQTHRNWLIDLHKKRFGDKIPLVDHTLDVVGTFARPVAGALAAASPLTSMDPVTASVVGVILGATVAGGVHAAKSTTRLISTGATGGLATPFLSAGEDAVSFMGAVLAIFLPVLAMAVFAVLLFIVLRMRRPKPAPA